MMMMIMMKLVAPLSTLEQVLIALMILAEAGEFMIHHDCNDGKVMKNVMFNLEQICQTTVSPFKSV